ncbi:hypothetical protein ACIF8T_36870 [Streptomyces sp. NPDC085946]|uniref:DUF7144 family membrane protein n=1 Tax=Streptomyces sp. NPDC085946 TaxID=3365744 RepID=UPI0037CF4B51
MATHTSRAHTPRGTAGRGTAAGVGGWVVFAAFLMIFNGVMTMLAGISAVANDDVFVRTRNYVFEFDLTTWGWIHLLLGLLVFLAGLALLRGAVWARVVGVALAGLSMIANFMWLPHTPVWAMALIAIDAAVIWALCSPRSTT